MDGSWFANIIESYRKRDFWGKVGIWLKVSVIPGIVITVINFIGSQINNPGPLLIDSRNAPAMRAKLNARQSKLDTRQAKLDAKLARLNTRQDKIYIDVIKMKKDQGAIDIETFLKKLVNIDINKSSLKDLDSKYPQIGFLDDLYKMTHQEVTVGVKKKGFVFLIHNKKPMGKRDATGIEIPWTVVFNYFGMPKFGFSNIEIGINSRFDQSGISYGRYNPSGYGSWDPDIIKTTFGKKVNRKETCEEAIDGGLVVWNVSNSRKENVGLVEYWGCGSGGCTTSIYLYPRTNVACKDLSQEEVGRIEWSKWEASQ